MNQHRVLFDVPLEPMIGSRFQPTGFPDLGPGEFQRPDGTNCLLVESAQSMANHLEGQAWSEPDNDQMSVFTGLPYVRVLDSAGSFLTSSRTEAHRLASAFVKESKSPSGPMLDVIRDRFGLSADSPMDHRRIARELFKLDPFCLLHGVFFADSKWPGQPKIARALTGFIEASGVRRADSGGVKKDHVRHAITEGSGGSSEGYGSVPFARTEWTSESIVASFSLDLKQLRSYGLPDYATQLLADIAHWEIASLLEGGLRLRTACDLTTVSDDVRGRDGVVLASSDELGERIKAGIRHCGDLLSEAKILEVTWNGGRKPKKGEAAEEAGE